MIAQSLVSPPPAISNGNNGIAPYGATVEILGDDWIEVECGGIDVDDFIERAQANAENGWGAVPIGRVDPARPDAPPHKVAWCRGYHGWDGRYATAEEIAAMPEQIVRRMVDEHE